MSGSEATPPPEKREQPEQQPDQPAPPPAPPPPPPGRQKSNWTGGRVAGMIAASLAALIGFVMLLGGLALIAAHAFARDDDGFYTTGNERLMSDAYAITTDEITLGADVADQVPEDLLGTVRVKAESTNPRPLFVGIARTEDIDGYLGGVGRSELTDFRHGDPVYQQFPGRAPAGPPGAQSFWVAESSGTGQQVVDWDAESGDWTVAVMNAGATRVVSVDADIGAKVGWLIWVGIGFAIFGLAVTAAGVILIIVISRRASRDPVPA